MVYYSIAYSESVYVLCYFAVCPGFPFCTIYLFIKSLHIQSKK